MEEAIRLILNGLCFAGLIICVYLLFRNNKVHKFLNKVSNLSYLYGMRKIKLGIFRTYDREYWEYYDSLPSYDRMLFSFKPLRLETYFTQEEIDDLTGKE